jgi:hypothetical protein
MCNAKKHSPGCMCGFGPPYPPRYHVSGVTEWEEEVVNRPQLVRRSLREAGWDERSIREFAQRYAALRREPIPRNSQIDRVRELLRMRERVIEKTWDEVVEVPLYRFGAPPVKGAKVEYSEGESRTHGSGWKLRFTGIGVARTTSVEISKSRTFVASDGAWKQVYVPVLVRVSEVIVYDGGRFVGRGLEAEVVPPKEAGDPLLQRRGIRSVDGVVGPGAGETLDFHDMIDLALAADTTGTVHKEKRVWVTDVGWDLSLPLGKLVDVTALVRVKRVRQLELQFELPAGHDYLAYLCKGFTYWDSPRRRIERPKRSSRRDSVK